MRRLPALNTLPAQAHSTGLSMQRPKLFVSGAAHIDRRGRIDGVYVPAASNPGSLREEAGGGALNAARNAVHHGVDVTLMSLRGGDLAGLAVADVLAESGIEDVSAIFLDRTTPSYTALLDPNGELIAGLADMTLYELGFTRQLRRRKIRDAVAAADAVFCEANMPEDALMRLADMAGGRPIYAIAISPAKARRLEPILASLSCLFMNRREARVLSGADDAAEAIKLLRDRGLRRGVITAGGEETIFFDDTGVFNITPPQLEAIADVTGAGDALAGVATTALMRGESFNEAVRRGMAAAMLTIASPNVVADYEDEAFETALARVGTPRKIS